MTAMTTLTSPPPLFPPGVALVAGGTGGVGRAVCVALALAGADVAFTWRSNATAAAELEAEIRATGRRAHAVQLDLCAREDCQRVVAEIAAQGGRIHTLVLATGGDISMTFTADIDPIEWDSIIAGDLTGCYNLLRATLPELRKGGGAVVAMTSAGLHRHPPKDILSVVPKAGLEALMRGIAREEGRYGIRANSLALGVIDIGLFKRLTDRLTPEFVEAMKKNTALRRFGTAEEVAEATLFLASSRSAFITGQSIAIDGGYSV